MFVIAAKNPKSIEACARIILNKSNPYFLYGNNTKNSPIIYSSNAEKYLSYKPWTVEKTLKSFVN